VLVRRRGDARGEQPDHGDGGARHAFHHESLAAGGRAF
jgi:hypothetical protein